MYAEEPFYVSGVAVGGIDVGSSVGIGVAVVLEAGIVSTSPTCRLRRLSTVVLFAAASSSTVMPKRRAMSFALSPDCTV
jgi:hypothetical protein